MQDLENKEQQNIESKEDNSQKYIDAIEEMKKNSVPKEELEAAQEENKRLLKALIDGDQIEVENQNGSEDLNEKIKKLHKELYKDDFQGTDLDYMSKTLELRNAIIERDGEDADPFLPHSHNYLITDADREAAKRVAEEVADAIESSNGSNKVFIATLQEKMVDSAPQRGRRK